ncbi:hypothetical protein V492_02274 [Pseudogymnoascus sp. VKM F-4246]|nr:hypothetical protein V492_02274 [Pseudogymnoascus sp. VKM F-4246]
MPSSTHQAKRPYAGTHSQHHQSSITSYFPSPSGAAPSPTTVRNASSPPVLPATVQSSLLNVGMRVRKSVPEGYKTGTYSSFALFSDQTPPSKQQQAQQQQQRRRAKQVPGGAARELTPFCGIMKVGGLAVQAPQAADEEYMEDDDEVLDEDDVPGMSSQGSTLSAFSTTATNKRRLSASSASDDEGAAQYSWADMEISPKSQAWGGAGNRTMALPRRMKKAGGQENGGGAGVDFEEAGFLDYQALGEVDMGGL